VAPSDLPQEFVAPGLPTLDARATANRSPQRSEIGETTANGLIFLELPEGLT
jgi:hypothetical protein